MSMAIANALTTDGVGYIGREVNTPRGLTGSKNDKQIVPQLTKTQLPRQAIKSMIESIENKSTCLQEGDIIWLTVNLKILLYRLISNDNLSI
jgi:hypothetical protein